MAESAVSRRQSWPRSDATSGRLPTAWIFSAGEIDAALQAGVVAAAMHRGAWPPAAFFGTSAGAYTAAACSMWSADPRLADRLCALWREMGPTSPLRRDVARRLIARHVSAGQRLEDLPVPVSVTLLDVDRGERVVISEGPLRDVLLAAVAWPVLHRPVSVGGRRCADAGFVAFCDVRAAHEAGFTQAVVVACCNRAQAPSSTTWIGRLNARFRELALHQDAGSKAQLMRDLMIVDGAVATLVLMPTLPPRRSIPRVQRIDRLIDLGRALGDLAFAHHLDDLGNVKSEADGRRTLIGS